MCPSASPHVRRCRSGSRAACFDPRRSRVLRCVVLARGRGRGTRRVVKRRETTARNDVGVWGMRTAALLIAIAGLALSLPAAPGTAAPQATAKIGAVVPLTGRYGGNGAQIKAGYEIAVEDINSRGGV